MTQNQEALAETPNPPPSGDIGELVERLKAVRQIEVQALHAAFSARNWHAAETAGNALRDRLDAFLPVFATSLQSQAAEIERLQDEADEAKTWPEWAEKILKVLQSHGAAEPDEDGIDLPEALSEWMEGYESATSSEITTLKSRIAELEKEREITRINCISIMKRGDDLQRKLGDAESRLSDAVKVIEAVNASAVLFASGKTLKEYAISGDVLQQVEAFLQSLSTTGGDNG